MTARPRTADPGGRRQLEISAAAAHLSIADLIEKADELGSGPARELWTEAARLLRDTLSLIQRVDTVHEGPVWELWTEGAKSLRDTLDRAHDAYRDL